MRRNNNATNDCENKEQTEIKFECTLCNKILRSRATLNRHIRGHTGELTHPCQFCARKFGCNWHLKEHIKAVHSTARPFKCDKCSYASATETNLQHHSLLHNGEFLRCEQCDFQTKWKKSLLVHKRVHSGEKPYKCKLCPYSSAQSSHLRTHTKTHSEARPFKCEQCPFTCKLKHTLSSHKSIHTGEKPYKCPLCPFAGRRPEFLKFHLFTHTGEQHYKCRICPYATFLYSSLVIHSRNHTNERPYMCGSCPYAAKNSAALKHHLRTHETERQYQCPLCLNNASITSINLVAHFRTRHRSSGGQYRCPNCPATFQEMHPFKRHLNCHLRTTNFPCSSCSFSGQSSKHLQSHITCHNDSQNGSKLALQMELRSASRGKVQCGECNFEARSHHQMALHYSTHLLPIVKFKKLKATPT